MAKKSCNIITDSEFSLVQFSDYEFKDINNDIIYHLRYTLNRTCQIFKYDNLPQEIDEKKLEILLQQGYIVAPKDKIFNPQTNKKEYMVFGKKDASFSGLVNQYNDPTHALITNAYLNISNEYTLPQDAVVIFNDSAHIGLIPMLAKYGKLLATNELTMYVNNILKRIQLILTASNDKEKTQADLFIKNIIRGDLATIKGSRFNENGNGIESLPTNQGGLAHTLTELIEMEQYLKASEFNELGLNANYNMKRESLNSAESNLNNDALLPLVQNMLDERLKGVELLNKQWGTNISVRFNELWQEKIDEIENTSNDVVEDNIIEEKVQEDVEN